MIRSTTRQSGSATANQLPQEGGGFMFWIVMMFCGEDMGEAIPPTLEARAMPMIRHGAKVDL